MPNMRLVWDNAVQRATVTATSQAGTYLPAKLKKPTKASVWRSVGTTATLTVTLPADEYFGCVALPFCNLSPTATIRVRVMSSGDGTQYDSYTLWANQAPALKVVGWTPAQAASAYNFGGGNSCAVWFNSVLGRSVVIDIVDTNNLQGYIEVAGLVVGEYWSPKLNPAWNAAMTPADSGKNSRSDAGSLRSDKGIRFRKLNMNLANMVQSDRADIVSILRAVGTSNPILVSLFPDDADKSLERDYMALCKLSQVSAVTLPSWNSYSAPLELEEV